MGQAKQRGALEQRIQQARQKTEASTPDHIVCNHCKTKITTVQRLDIKNLRGIEAAFAGECPACGQSTYAVKGEPKSVAAFMEAMQRATGSEAILGSQTIKNNK